MLFPMPENLARTWELVATATARNQLGTAAKVAAADEGRGDRVPRLVCVYTKDFGDTADVKRVLEKLVELELVPRPARDPKGVRSVYYKCGRSLLLALSSCWLCSKQEHEGPDTFDQTHILTLASPPATNGVSKRQCTRLGTCCWAKSDTIDHPVRAGKLPLRILCTCL